jgi:hypothetical protein
LCPEARDEAQSKEMSKHDGSYIGENVEKEVFLKLKDFFVQSKLKNVTIFSGWKDNGIIEKGISREFDFIIVSGDAKKVFVIEVKTKNPKDNKELEKATLQISQGYNFLRKKIPFDNTWKFVSIVYLKYNEAAKTGNFILGPNSSFKDFFEKHLESLPPGPPNHASYWVTFF